jgi:hypothetical protein
VSLSKIVTIWLIMAAAVLTVLMLGAQPAHADLADRCRIEGLSPILTGAGKPSVVFRVYSCPNSSYPWIAKSWCAKNTILGPPWTMCANTSVAVKQAQGNETWTIPVGNGSWGCNSNDYYTSYSEIWDADTGTWIANAGSYVSTC